jgi:uncharacterized membrane protein YgcG
MKSFLVAVVFLLSPFLVLAEEVSHFDVLYNINDDATVSVVETIVYDFGVDERHGIYRTLNTQHAQPSSAWYKERYVDISGIEVTRNNEAEPFDQSAFGDSIEVKIGDPDATISGQQTYTIAYTLKGALSYGTQGAELYWNVTGNEWDVPIASVSAHVRSGYLNGTHDCYQGVIGSLAECDAKAIVGTIAMFEAKDLAPGEGLTVATALIATSMPEVILEQMTSVIPLAMAALWLVFLGLFLWRYRQKENPDQPVVAQYEPYQNYLPMYTGVLLDNALDPRDVVAGILYLAEQGFLTIRRTEAKALWIFTTTDYEFILRRPVEEMTIPTLNLILTNLLFTSVHEVGTTVTLSALSENKTANYALMQSLRKNAIADVERDGFLAATPLNEIKKAIVPGLLVCVAFLVLGGVILAIVVGVVSIVMVALALNHRRSRTGFEALNHIEGFKLFLSVTDKERFDFHNAPEKSPELFMKYLPYAVALGVEEKWAKVFEDITLTQPEWFEGGSMHAFSAAALTSDLSAFSSALSSSSGVSGSSGGGSSGGGGGGGGGGSW